MEPDVGVGALAIDVSRLVERSVAHLYSHLVTRPTGRAVRLAIEAKLGEVSGPSISLVDLSEVTVLDFSCADEVVAKLLLRYDEPRARVHFVFRGVDDRHRGPIETVLERHELAAVAEVRPGRFELVGSHSLREGAVWARLEQRGRIAGPELQALFPERDDRGTLQRLAERRLVFRHPGSGAYHALGRLVREAR